MAQRKNKLKIALIYDFDGTLSPLNMQEYDFLKSLHIEKDAFWAETNDLVKKKNANNVLCYMKLMLEKAASKHVPVRYKNFVEFGKSIQLYKGVEQWFDLVNELGRKNDIVVEHYINSSGLKEMIEGTPVYKHFKQVYASNFMYDENGVAVWPAVAVDFTTKTQFLFMINKGIKDIRDNHKVNEFVAEDDRPVPFKHMIYFGDGETDIPCMRMIKNQGGYAIAVYNPKNKDKKSKVEKLIQEDRVNFVYPADYSTKGKIYPTVEAIMKLMKSEYDLRQIELKQKEETGK